MCAFGRAVAISVNLNTHKFKDAYKRAINTSTQVSPGVGSGTSEVCFLLDIAQQLWLPCRPSGCPGKHFPSRRGSPGRQPGNALPSGMPCSAQEPSLTGRGRGKPRVLPLVEHLPPSGRHPHRTFRGRLFPGEEIESEWAYENQTKMGLGKRISLLWRGLQGASLGLRKYPLTSPRLQVPAARHCIPEGPREQSLGGATGFLPDISCNR